MSERWYERASDLLAEPDPGSTPFLVESLIVEGSIAALVGPSKKGKTWTLLDLAIAVTTGELALGRFEVREPGPVLLVLEESGRAALHRRIEKLARGQAIVPERLHDFHFAANRRVRLDVAEWRDRLLEAASAQPWRLIAFDPLARVKGLVDENVQREVGAVLDFLRELRAESSAAVLYVHHTGHEGTRHRGSSDFESYWESKLTLTENTQGRQLQAEHRESEGAGPFGLSFGFDAVTDTVRLRALGDELEERVREYIAAHPAASANEVDENVEGNRKRILELVRQLREGGSQSWEPAGTAGSGSEAGGGSPAPPFRGAGTTPPDLDSKVVPIHPELPGTTQDGEA